MDYETVDIDPLLPTGAADAEILERHPGFRHRKGCGKVGPI